MPKTLTQKAFLTLIAEVALLLIPLFLKEYLTNEFSESYFITWLVLVIAINLALVIMLIINKPKNFGFCIPFLLLIPILPFAVFIFLISGRVC